MRTLETSILFTAAIFAIGCAQLPTSNETPQPVAVVDESGKPFAITDGRGNPVEVRMLSADSGKRTAEVTPAAEPAPVTAADTSADAASATERRELGAVYYGVDQADLSRQAMRELDEVVAWLKESPSRSITVEAFSDKSGTEAHNLQLSKARGAGVKRYLIREGVPASRVSVVGKGENPGTERKAVVITN